MPTTPPNLTTPGTILGTFQYMAPEQIEGMEADARTDIFAFGAVVYEMATGKKAFEGRSQASVMASILDREPAPMSSLVPLLPPAFERVVRKCLAKEPDARWQTARDLLDELKWIESAPGETTVAGTIAPAATATRGRGRAALVAAGLVIAAAIGAGVAWVGRPMPAPEPVALTVETPGAVRGDGFALSPDGRQLAFIASDGKGNQALWLRPLASTTARMIPGTEQASFAFWSPDSRAVGFFTETQLKRVEVASGALQTIARTTGATGLPNGASWSSSGVILFSRGSSGVWRVQASGGEPVAVTKTRRGRNGTHRG